MHLDIDYKDLEAIAALEFGTLEDWAFDVASFRIDAVGEALLLTSWLVTQKAIKRVGK